MKDPRCARFVFVLGIILFSVCAIYGQVTGNSKEANGGTGSSTTKNTNQIEIIYRPLPPLDSPMAHYAGFKPGETILPKGYTYEPGRPPLASDMILDRDVAIKMRDGIILYADIYRPVGKEKVPAIICIGSAGKGGHGSPPVADWLDAAPKAAAPLVSTAPPAEKPQPKTTSLAAKSSGLEAHLSLDPAQWVPEGYAIVNVDQRGSFMSGGNFEYFGPQLAKDGYDTVEFIAKQEWSSGKVALGGAMWYGMTQWHIAAERPPHLTAIAPWDAGTNIYRDEFVRDGIPRDTSGIGPKTVGNGRSEDIGAMTDKYPLMNSYWESRIPQLQKIDVPAYMVISYTTQHTRGGFEAFNEISSKDKWLRVRNRQEWSDMYEEENRSDMKRFFDHYLKGIENGWEKTPRVRLSVIDPGGSDIVERSEDEFPLRRQEARKLYLDATSKKLSTVPVQKEDKETYNTDKGYGKVVFTLQFDKDTEITGLIKLRLWVEADGANDMDIFTTIKKLDENGQSLEQRSSAHPVTGPDGRLRVSERQLDLKKSTPLQPVHTHRVAEPLKPGEIVPVEIGFWPTGMIFHAGQQLELSIAGYDVAALGRGQDRPLAKVNNHGNHIIHTGGRYDSYLLVPVISSSPSQSKTLAARK